MHLFGRLTEVRQVHFSDPSSLKWTLGLLFSPSANVLHPNVFTYCRCESREDKQKNRWVKEEKFWKGKLQVRMTKVHLKWRSVWFGDFKQINKIYNRLPCHNSTKCHSTCQGEHVERKKEISEIVKRCRVDITLSSSLTAEFSFTDPTVYIHSVNI
jgi:hypothetical protein